MKGVADMIELKDGTADYLARFERIEKRTTDRGPDWLLPVRKAAIARFAELGFPTTRNEEWRFTNVAPIVNGTFVPAGQAEARSADVAALGIDGVAARLVFVNGRFDAGQSSTDGLPPGVRVVSLATAFHEQPPALAEHLTRYASCDEQAFTALNTALMEDGAFIHVPRGVVVDRPIHLLFLSAPDGQPMVTHPRSLIVADTNSQVTVIETHTGRGATPYFTNRVTEVVAQENAVVDFYNVEDDTDEAFHVATLQLHQQRSSNVTAHTLALGGGLVRNNVHAILDGEGGTCTLNGLSMADGRRHIDNHLVVEHAQPRCDSREFYKGVLDDHGRSVFSGRIIVREDAQKTDAKQANMSLLLSEDAQAESKPQLEIFADDVKCTHGVTVGQVDEEAVFYLRSRGISAAAARSLLVYAFAQEVVDRVRVEPLRAQLQRLLFDRLPGHDNLRGLK